MVDRVELYARLPLLEADRWWLDLAAGAPGERVLEFGAGAGRLARAMAASGVSVTAVERDPVMVARLRQLAGPDPNAGAEVRARSEAGARSEGHVDVVHADAAALPPDVADEFERGFGLVVLASSLLNEVADAHTRRALLTAARRACRLDGVVALQVLGPWWLTDRSERSSGELLPMAGGPGVGVDILPVAAPSGDGAVPFHDDDVRRRRALLTYRFPDGAVLEDELDAVVLTSVALDRHLEDAGLELTGRWGARPPDPANELDPVWHVLARPG